MVRSLRLEIVRGRHVRYLLLVTLVQRCLERRGHAPVLEHGSLKMFRLLLRLFLHLDRNLNMEEKMAARTRHKKYDVLVTLAQKTKGAPQHSVETGVLTTR